MPSFPMRTMMSVSVLSTASPGVNTSLGEGGLYLRYSFPDPMTKHATPFAMMPRTMLAKQNQSATRVHVIHPPMLMRIVQIPMKIVDEDGTSSNWLSSSVKV